MWGGATADDGLLQPVNGYYRASRGTFAQFGVPLPHPERVIDTVLAARAGPALLRPRAAERVQRARHRPPALAPAGHRVPVRGGGGGRARLLGEALGWSDGRDSDSPHPTVRRGLPDEPGLQGTEMWLAIIWYLADLLGSPRVGYRPRGVHRPEPAVRLA